MQQWPVVLRKTLYNADPDTQIFGFEEGYRGLMYNDYILMKPNDFSGILDKGRNDSGFF